MRHKHRESSSCVKTGYPHTFDNIYPEDVFSLCYYNFINKSFKNRKRKQAQQQPTYSKIVIRFIFPFEIQIRTRIKVKGPQSSEAG